MGFTVVKSAPLDVLRFVVGLLTQLPWLASALEPKLLQAVEAG